MKNNRILEWLNFLLLVTLILCCGKDVAASNPPQDGELWRDTPAPERLAAVEAERLPRQYRLLAANAGLLRATLDAAPLEGAGGTPVTLALPLPGGGLASFELEEYTMMEPGLSAKFPEFKTYLGRGVDDPAATVRVAWTATGLHAAIFTADNIALVEPYRAGDVTRYIAYNEQDAAVPWMDETADIAMAPAAPQAPQADSRSNSIRRTFRLAVATTGEYAAAHGGTVTDTLSVVVATVNELNGFYEREVSIRFTLVANNDQIIYTDPDADPYTNDDKSLILGENQTTLDAVIGSANYDVGHCFHAGGGLATVGTPCRDTRKARGVSSGVIGQVIHEIGHQFDAPHTQNAGNCGRWDYAAYEPGSGFTIMSYAGDCDQSVLDPGEARGMIFATSSFEQIIEYVTTDSGTCAATTDPGNAAPIVEAGPDYTIPRETPFTLTGSGSDADGDALTYIWEEHDLGPEPITTTMPNTDADGNARPIFRPFLPVAEPQRTFPRLPAILSAAYAWNGESLPNISRVMQFRLTARDGRGGVSYDTASVTVAASAGPFRITAPRGNLIFLPRGSQQTLTWDVANTTAAPVNCPNVNLLLSTDGGNTFPITLAANTPNDGSELVTLPDLESTALIFKVACANNIFFDVAPGGLLCTPIFQDNHEDGFSGWTIRDQEPYTNPWQSMTDGGYSGNNYFYVDTRHKRFTDSLLESDAISVTSDAAVLVFVHRYEMELRYGTNYASDGGVVEISVNGGDWADVGEEAFILNGYNHVVTTSYQSPLMGRPVFSGDSAKYVISLADLSGLAQNGDNLRIRFRQATDGWSSSVGDWGWAVDDVGLCRSDPVPALSIQKTVAYTRRPIEPGDRVTYTVVVANSGGADAGGVHVTDALPAHLSGSSLDQTVTVTAHDGVTWTLPVTVALNAPDGPLLNTAVYSYTSAEYCQPTGVCAGSAQAQFAVGGKFVYLPLILRQ